MPELRPTLDDLIGKSNEELLALSDAELDTYLAEALTVQLKIAPSYASKSGSNSISTAYKGKSSARAKGPSQLAKDLAQRAIDSEADAELAALEAEVREETRKKHLAKNQPKLLKPWEVQSIT